MKRLIAVSLLQLMNFGLARAHLPEGVVMPIGQMRSWDLPIMDGDLSDWDHFPGWMWLNLYSRDHNGDPMFYAAHGGYRGMYGTQSDPSDLSFRLAIGWNDEFNRLYFAIERYDDVLDRDAAEPPGECGGDDAVEIHVDADHSGGLLVYSYDDFPNTDDGRAEHRRLKGRNAQTSLFRFPPIGDGNTAWNWLWVSSATWHDKEPYSCCPGSYEMDGEHGTETTLQAEWWSVYFNTLVHNCPEHSTVADLTANQIIGMTIAICDIDAADSNGHNSVWVSNGPDAHRYYADSDVLGDWILLPEVWKAVSVEESVSWGQIKASFQD